MSEWGGQMRVFKTPKTRRGEVVPVPGHGGWGRCPTIGSTLDGLISTRETPSPTHATIILPPSFIWDEHTEPGLSHFVPRDSHSTVISELRLVTTVVVVATVNNATQAIICAVFNHRQPLARSQQLTSDTNYHLCVRA